MSPRLPVSISVPHGGTRIPRQAHPHCILDLPAILQDGDTWARQLYDLRHHVLAFVDTPIARAVLDMNRRPDDLPPDNADGVVKSVTVGGRQVWRSPDGPPSSLASRLISTDHARFHESVRRAASTPGVKMHLDCHTMLAAGPEGGMYAGQIRPPACLGNLGGPEAEPVDGPTSAPAQLVLSLRDELARSFSDLHASLVLSGPAVRVNDPFRGGYVTRRHGLELPVPVVQLELSRALYMDDDPPLSDVPPTTVSSRLADLRDRLLLALSRLF